MGFTLEKLQSVFWGSHSPNKLQGSWPLPSGQELCVGQRARAQQDQSPSKSQVRDSLVSSLART